MKFDIYSGFSVYNHCVKCTKESILSILNHHISYLYRDATNLNFFGCFKSRFIAVTFISLPCLIFICIEFIAPSKSFFLLDYRCNPVHLLIHVLHPVLIASYSVTTKFLSLRSISFCNNLCLDFSELQTLVVRN